MPDRLHDSARDLDGIVVGEIGKVRIGGHPVIGRPIEDASQEASVKPHPLANRDESLSLKTRQSEGGHSQDSQQKEREIGKKVSSCQPGKKGNSERKEHGCPAGTASSS